MGHPEGRPTSGWTHTYVSPREPVVLRANTPVDEEVFSSLEYISEIPSVGYKFLKQKNTPHPKKTFALFQSYIRQAKTFYQTGNQLHYRASALMYYYSFLNLAKAYISLSNPSAVSKSIGHGLSIGKFSSRKFVAQTISVPRRSGVFQILYETETNRKIPKSFQLNIVSLLGYCSDVQYEYETAGYGRHRILSAKARIFQHTASKISWPVLAIYKFHLLSKFKKSLNKFDNYFEQIAPKNDLIKRTFEINAEAYSSYSYFQSKKTYPWVLENNNEIIEIGKIRGDILEACKIFFESPIYNDQNDFKLALPLKVNNQIPMNQPLAIYILIFYIGSLVRYHPEYLEKLLNSKDAWIIERFVRGSCITFLRYIANAILGKDYLFAQR